MSNSYDPIDTCPYDPVHRIMRSRMQYHLTKCSKNWPCSKKKQCPYDARHVINQIEFNYHLSICPQRESVWHNKLEENEKVEDLGILPIDPSPVLSPAEDVWEEEENVESYDPIKHTENKLITRILIGAPKSQRKKHRLQERLRISRLADDAPKKENDPVTQSKNNQHTASTIKHSIPKEASVEAKQVYRPLRTPKELPINTLNTSKIATINDSTVVHKIQNSVNQNEQLEFIQEESNSNKNLDPQTTFSYAAATKNVFNNQRQQYSSIESDRDVIESKQSYTEKENNNSFFNKNKEDSNLHTTCSYAAAAKSVLTNQRQRYSSIESDYDVTESKKYIIENEKSNSSFLNRNKAFDLQASPFSYAAAAKNTLANQQYSYIENDYDFIESKKWDTEKKDNNSSFSNRSKNEDLPATSISYAAAAKIVPTLQRRQNNGIQSIKDNSKKDNNSLLTTKRNKEIFDQQRTFNYATAAAKYVPPYLRHGNNNIERDSNVVTESIKCETEKENNSLLTNVNQEDLDMQTRFNYATDAENIPTIRRPRNSSVESDCDIISESIKYNCEKENDSLLTNINKKDLDLQTTILNYASDAENVPTIRRPRNNSIESDCDIISESIKCDTEENNNSSFFNRNKVDSDMQTFSYATAAKNLSTNRRSRNSSIESDCDIISESTKCDTEKNNNSSFFNRNKIDSDLQATTFNDAATTKYVPLNRQLNNSIESDYDLQSAKFSSATATKNVLTNQPQRNSSTECDYDMHTVSLFGYATAAKNALINRRPCINSTESDCNMGIETINYETEKEHNSLFFNNAIDRNLVKVTETIKALTINDKGHKIQSESLDSTLEPLNRTTNYSTITNHGLNRININKPLTSEKKVSRCAANLHFTNLRQYLQNTK